MAKKPVKPEDAKNPVIPQNELEGQAMFADWLKAQEAKKHAPLQGQTKKQPVVWRCNNPDCEPEPEAVAIARSSIDANTINEPIKTVFGEICRPSKLYFEFLSEHDKCPKCTYDGAPMINKRALIHLLLEHPRGPIVGQIGKRWFMACDPTRTTMATHDNGEACTGDSMAANCPECLKKIGDKVVQGGRFINKSFIKPRG